MITILSFLNGEMTSMMIPIPFLTTISSGLQVGIWITDFVQNVRMTITKGVIYHNA